ncbi:MAG: FAD-dependent oxidoreductase [Arachnia sp.]
MSAVAVVGGGLAGLLAAHRLLGEGHDVSVWEASPTPGGMIASVELGGVRVDAGAEGYAVRSGVGRALCEELGLEVAGPAGVAHVWRRAGAYPMADGIVGIPGSLDDPALGALTADGWVAVARDREVGPEVGADATTVADLVRARMGEEALERLVAPVAHGVYATAPDRLLLSAVAPTLLAALTAEGSLMAAVAACRAGGPTLEQPVGGAFRIIEALADRVRDAGGRLRCGTPVTSLARRDGGFVLRAGDEDVAADRVVIATPAAPAARLLAGVGVEIEPPPTRTARFAVLVLDAPALAADPVGSGVLVAQPHEGLSAKALTHYSAKWPWARAAGREVLRLSYAPETDVTLERALADAALLTGKALDPAQVRGFASVEWPTMPSRIDPATRDRLVGVAADAGVDLVGAWIDGNGVAPVTQGVERVRR